VHKKVHTREDNHVCYICNYKTLHKSALAKIGIMAVQTELQCVWQGFLCTFWVTGMYKHTYRGEDFPVWLLWESISLQAQLECP